MTIKRIRFMSYVSIASCVFVIITGAVLAPINLHYHRWLLVALNVACVAVSTVCLFINLRTLRKLERLE